MIKRITIGQLKPGMYIHDLNCGWLDHPFLRSSFPVNDNEIVSKIRNIGVINVYIDTEKGKDVLDGENITNINVDLNNRLHKMASDIERKEICSDLKDEIIGAQCLHREASKVIQKLMSDVRIGNQLDICCLEPLMENMIGSIFRHQDALLPLLKLKRHDDYTFEHSVSVCALLIAFAKRLNIPKEEIKQIAIGGILHDIGKVRIPDQILNKPGRLNELEYMHIKLHVDQGINLLSDYSEISNTSLDVVAQHHERFNGSGYPGNLSVESISKYGQMAGIVDVYDAISSTRCYHKSIPPTLALKRLLEWSEHHFSPDLVSEFIRTLGIYPTGSLVHLESGRLAVVVEQGGSSMLEPIVRVFFNTRKRCYISPELIDLKKGSDRISSYDEYARWNISADNIF